MSNAEFQKRWGDKWDADAAAHFQSDIEEYLSRMINEKHAPLMIPRVTIDAASAHFGLISTGWGNFNFGTTGSTTSSTFATLLSYTGRGVLRMLVAGEVSGSGILARTAGVRLTVDGNVIYSDSSGLISAQSQAKVIVGALADWTSTSEATITDDPIGIPFNQSILIEGLISSGTLSAAWRLSKKL